MVASGGCLHIFLRRMVLRPASHGYLSQGHRRSCLVGCSEALVLSELIPSIIEPIPQLYLSFPHKHIEVEPDWNWNYLLANSRATNKDIGTRKTLASKSYHGKTLQSIARAGILLLLGRTIRRFKPSLGTTGGADEAGMSYK